jgi:hypothetical protein
MLNMLFGPDVQFRDGESLDPGEHVQHQTEARDADDECDDQSDGEALDGAFVPAEGRTREGGRE